MNFILSYLKSKLRYIAFFLFCGALLIISFCLYSLPVLACVYPLMLCAFCGIVFLIIDMCAEYKKHKNLCEIKKRGARLIDDMPHELDIIREDYRELTALLCDEVKTIENAAEARYDDMIAYYTVWAHQIKTPLASMHLSLQNDNTGSAVKLRGELFRIEQYVEMVLTFLRLNSDSTDYVIKEYDLDGIIKQSVKKFAGEFIMKRIKLEYIHTDIKVLTDEKWLCFCIEQILSNSLKYTKRGSIKIYTEEPKTLCISDTGIGIAPEDLPRIFENGYTGLNGRSDRKASGIGLYLCKRICKNLGHGISAQSALDEGTTIRIYLDRETRIQE